jgi:hypothetical protein
MDYNNTMCIDAQLGNLHMVRRSLERVRSTVGAHTARLYTRGSSCCGLGALNRQHSTRKVLRGERASFLVGRTMDNACESRTSVQRSCGHAPAASRAVHQRSRGGRLSIRRTAWTRARVAKGSACGTYSTRMDFCIASRRSTSGPPSAKPCSPCRCSGGHLSRRVRHDPCRLVYMHESKSRTEALGPCAGQSLTKPHAASLSASLCLRRALPAGWLGCRRKCRTEALRACIRTGCQHVDRGEGEGWRGGGDTAQGASALHSCDPNFADRTALIRAAEYGHTAIVKVTQLTPPLLLSLRALHLGYRISRIGSE